MRNLFGATRNYWMKRFAFAKTKKKHYGHSAGRPGANLYRTGFLLPVCDKQGRGAMGRRLGGA